MDFLAQYFNIIFFVALVALGYTAGSWAERKHYRSIEKREQEQMHLPVATFGKKGASKKPIRDAQLVSGSCVVSIDYFKRIAASLRNIFGGRVRAYESLVDRARREAILRMRAQAKGAHVIINVRVETSAIGQQANKKRGLGSIEAFAYGTAVTFER